jgi:hypothetical protein
MQLHAWVLCRWIDAPTPLPANLDDAVRVYARVRACLRACMSKRVCVRVCKAMLGVVGALYNSCGVLVLRGVGQLTFLRRTRPCRILGDTLLFCAGSQPPVANRPTGRFGSTSKAVFKPTSKSGFRTNRFQPITCSGLFWCAGLHRQATKSRLTAS